MRLSPAVNRLAVSAVALLILSAAGIVHAATTTSATNTSGSGNSIITSPSSSSSSSGYNYNAPSSSTGYTSNGTSAPGSGFGSSYNNSSSNSNTANSGTYNQATTDALLKALTMQQMGQQQNQPGMIGNLMGQQQDIYTEEQQKADLKNPDSAAYKANKLADDAKRQKIVKKYADALEDENMNILDPLPPPPEMETLQDVHKTFKNNPAFADEVLSKEAGLDMRRDSMREAALSYGARGGLSKRNYEIIEQLNGYGVVLEHVFDFRQLLIKAPSGMLIEPPIVNESLDATIVDNDGVEAATADQILKINKQAKIVTAPRNWRNYLVMTYETEIAPPPRVLWPKNKVEQAEWDEWVRQGWEAGFSQGEDIFEFNLNQMVADYNGMVRYRMLLAEGKISQPYAMQEDRGVTGGKDEMRVGDRALRITGPSEFLTGADLWTPASR